MLIGMSEQILRRAAGRRHSGSGQPAGDDRQAGRDIAADYVTSAGWTVLERNWRCRYGELDIIAVDGSVLVVVEVKTRASRMYTDPAEAVPRTNWPRCGVPRRCGWRSRRRGFNHPVRCHRHPARPVDPTDPNPRGLRHHVGVFV